MVSTLSFQERELVCGRLGTKNYGRMHAREQWGERLSERLARKSVHVSFVRNDIRVEQYVCFGLV